MKKIIYAVMLLLGVSILSSCEQENGGNSEKGGKGELTGTWEWSTKVSIHDNMSISEEFVEDLGYVVFNRDGTATFMDWDKKNKGTFKYTFVIREKLYADEMGTEYDALLSFISPSPLSGGRCDYSKSTFGCYLDWEDITGVECSLRKIL